MRTGCPSVHRSERHLDVAIASTHECAASLDVCLARRWLRSMRTWSRHGQALAGTRDAAGPEASQREPVREGSEPYGSARFPFVELDLYQVALRGVRWTHELLEELDPKARVRRKLDTSTTGTVLNIAEGHGRASTADQNRFMKTAHRARLSDASLARPVVARKEIRHPVLPRARPFRLESSRCSMRGAPATRRERKQCETRLTTTATTTDNEWGSLLNRPP
jgi:hypothetical protein